MGVRFDWSLSKIKHEKPLAHPIGVLIGVIDGGVRVGLLIDVGWRYGVLGDAIGLS